MRSTFPLAILVSTLVTSTVTHADQTANDQTYRVCNVSGCQTSLINQTVNRMEEYTKTQYPIVLVHGINGYAEQVFKDKKNNTVQREYWPTIPQRIYEGGAKVFVVAVAAFDSPVARGMQLLDQVKQIKALTGATKVNLIAHSQGAQTARFVAAAIPESVASVTSIAGTNKGTSVASASNLLLFPVVSQLVAYFGNNILEAIDHEDYQQHLIRDLVMLSPIGAANFNSRYPQAVPSDCGNGLAEVNGVKYYSMGGAQSAAWSAIFFGAGVFRDSSNDTIVGRCSTHLGTVLNDKYPLDHTGLVNRGKNPQNLDVPSIYRTQANRLKGIGL